MGLIGEEDLFDELLSKRRATLGAVAASVTDDGTGDTNRTHAVVLIEVAVLDGNSSVLHVFAYFVTVNN
ncbi:hypothetical protein D3C85_1762130 [compost metagenome]